MAIHRIAGSRSAAARASVPSAAKLTKELKSAIDQLRAAKKFDAGRRVGTAVAASVKLPARVEKHAKENDANARSYGFGEAQVFIFKLPSGERVYAVTGILSDTVRSTAFFSLDGRPLAQAEDGQGGFGWSTVSSS